MRPISRRNALIAGGLGTAATVAGGAGLWWSLNSTQQPNGAGGGNRGGAAPVQGAGLHGPAELRSADGRLQLTLDTAPGRVELGGRQTRALCYNGTVPGPTLRLRPGDELSVRLVNGLNEPTNLHVHGLHVSPQGDATTSSWRSCPDRALTTATGCRRTTRRACTGTTRITTAWSQTRSSPGSSGRSSSKIPRLSR